MTEDRLLEFLIASDKYFKALAEDFSLWRIDVLYSAGFLLATVIMIVMAHKLVKLIKSQTRVVWPILSAYGVVVISWMLGISAAQTLVFTPYGLSFEVTLSGFLSILIALLLLLLTPFMLFAIPIALTLGIYSASHQNLRKTLDNSAKGAINNNQG